MLSMNNSLVATETRRHSAVMEPRFARGTKKFLSIHQLLLASLVDYRLRAAAAAALAGRDAQISPDEMDDLVDAE
ncbi:hypothetical protein C2857_005836 [Epichloe festucae Fl1]|uniref:Uncharacterized protein n=1 Tax=Epichloe festucae (strain Fl1) TaxID=877507 RepID=A0A7S9KL90_EPIFF|nr:hypothetical protein C2857_005836 [Epichloe festucae Fl1]